MWAQNNKFFTTQFWQNLNQCGHKITSFSSHNFGKMSMWAQQNNKFFTTQLWQNINQCGHNM
jgi:hypothetical protein